MSCTEYIQRCHVFFGHHNILILLGLFLLSGCTGTPTQESGAAASGAVGSEQTLAADEINQYREAITHLNENRLDRAEELLTSIITRRPEFAGPWVNMALLQIRQNQLDKAEHTLQRALERNPDMPQAHNLLGYIEKKRGHITKAKDHFLRAIASKPDYAIAHYNMALMYDIYLQDIPNALIHYKKYLEITGGTDEDTSNWVNELERYLSRGES